ncbi:major facilitator superfamily protein [Escherichia coli]|nr:major facilitator superfamily protein [Escherichia coli]
MAATVAKSTTCKFEYLARLTYSGYLAFAACLAGHIVSWDQLTGLLRDIGWLPAILISHGYSEAQAGSLHGLLQLATAAPGLLIPLFLHHVKDQRGIAAFVALMCAVGAVGLCFMPAHAITWTLLFGFGSGATMILGLTFIGLRASSAHQAAALSGMAQSVGYLLAACGPPLMGKIHDANGNWSVPLMGVAILSLLMAIFGLCAGRDKEIR